MPAFIPINPPPQAQVQFAETNVYTEGPTTVLASHARVEEKVRDLVLGYQVAMKTWANGQLRDARDNLDALCENVLVCHKQEAHIESECNAYCMEYGGVPMSRMRFLAFANSGYLHMAGICEQTLTGLDVDLVCGSVGPDAEEALSRALTLLTAALQFDTADAAHYLAIGNCALLLGQPDVALSALSSGMGPLPDGLGLRGLSSYQGTQNCTHLEQTISKRFGPRQWWCVKAMVYTLLVRGDTELACSIVKRVAELNPDPSHSLLLPPNLQPPVLVSLPAAVVPHALYSLAPPRLPEGAELKEVPVLNIRTDNDRVSLIELGSKILNLFEQSIQSTPKPVSSALHTHVAFAINEEPAAGTDSVALFDPAQHAICYVEADAVSNTADGGGGIGSSNTVTEQLLADAAADSAADADRDHVSADEANNGCLPRSNKRRESLSGDEMPAKRRSTRFIERASSGVSANVSSAGISSTVPGLGTSRTSAARSSQRRALALSLDAAESPAYCRARDMAGAWFEAAGVATRSEFFDALGASAFVASVAAHQARLDRGAPTKPSVSQSTIGDSNNDNKAEWGLADVCPKDKGASSGDSPLAERRSSKHGTGDDQYMDSLTALITSRLTPEVSCQPARENSVALNEVITFTECQAVLEGNHGIVDLLLRFIDTTTLRFYVAPADFIKSKDLKRLCLCAVQHTFDVLLDLVGNHISLSKSIDALQHALRQATFVLLLLTDAIASQCDSREMWTTLHAAWIDSVRSSMASAEVPASEQCAGLYLLSEAWTCYEIDVLANDVSSAAVHIEQCLLLLEQVGLSGEASLAVSCAFSGELLSLNLVRERQQHLALFKRLSEAYRLAAKHEQRAADMLSSILVPFSAQPSRSLPFRQRISAVRLLASLYRQKSAASNESRVILYELALYLSRLLACRADTTIPVRAALVRSVECLRRLYEMSEDNAAARQYLEQAADHDGSKRLVMQLVAVALAITCHYALDPALECSLAAVEVDFVGLAFWLAAKLGASLDVACLEKVSSGSPALPDDSDEAASLDSYIEFLSAVHELLGERGACTSASGALLKHLLLVCRRMLDKDRDNLPCWDVAASCLRCLFDIRLHSSNIQVHVCEHLDMDAECANLVYLLVEPELVDAIRNRKGTGLRSDFKTILEKATSALGDLDIEKHPRLSMNMDVIDDYLDGPSMPSFGVIDLALRAGTLELPDSRLPLRQSVYDSSIFAAYLTQPFVRAAAQHESLLFRMRSGLTRAVGDYDKIFDDYRLNIALGAEPSEAWYHLGRAFSDLADEMLLGTASEIADCKYDIALLQRRSLSCAIQASQKLPPLLLSGAADKKRPKLANNAGIGYDSDSDSSQDDGSDFALRQHVRVASSTGHLLYRIAARPLPLLALRVLPSNVLVSDDGSESGQQWDIGEWGGNCDRSAVRNLSASLTKRYAVAPQSHQVYALARVMFARASRLDASNWEWAYMLGKIASKLGDSLTACALYLKASHLAVSAGSKCSAVGAGVHSGQALGPTVGSAVTSATIPEVAMDALCKLLTSLSKLLLSEQIDAAAARRFVGALPAPCAPNTDSVVPSSASSDPPLEGSSHHGSGPPEKPVNDSEVLAVFRAIRSVVSQMCASDKRRRHH
ncbi:Histone transcription regulator 3, partial [Coemansia sp. RSA 922]